MAFLRHLHADPVLEAGLIVDGPASTADGLGRRAKSRGWLGVNLLQRVVGEIRGVYRHVFSSSINTLIEVVLREGCTTRPTLSTSNFNQLPVHITTNHAELERRNILLDVLEIVHDLVLGLETVTNVHMIKTVRSNAITNLSIVCIIAWTPATVVVIRQLSEVILIRIIRPNTPLLTLRKIWICIEGVGLTSFRGKILHLNSIFA